MTVTIEQRIEQLEMRVNALISLNNQNIGNVALAADPDPNPYVVTAHWPQNPTLQLINMQAAKAENGFISGVMPSLDEFKQRREKLRLSMQDVTDGCGVSKATISRIENGHDADYSTVKKLHEFYSSSGA